MLLTSRQQTWTILLPSITYGRNPADSFFSVLNVAPTESPQTSLDTNFCSICYCLAANIGRLISGEWNELNGSKMAAITILTPHYYLTYMHTICLSCTVCAAVGCLDVFLCLGRHRLQRQGGGDGFSDWALCSLLLGW